jgi:signal transduction histidine kinase
VTTGKLGGDVAIEVSHQLAEPLRGLRDRLGLVVDHLERHVAHATGPTPYPYHALQALRQDLAEAYLEATQLARRVDELDRALDIAGDAPRWFDLAATVDLGIRLAGQDLASGIELLIDLGNVPPTRGSPGALALLVAQLLSTSAASAHALAGSSLSIRVSSQDDDTWGVVLIADNGNGADIGELGELARAVVAPWGGSADVASTLGQGCTFELRLATQP